MSASPSHRGTVRRVRYQFTDVRYIGLQLLGRRACAMTVSKLMYARCQRICETVEQTAARRATDRNRSNRHRSTETPQQTEAQRAADRCCSRRRRSCLHHFGQLSCRGTIARSAIVARNRAKRDCGSYNFKTACANFTKFFVQVVCGLGSVVL